ncbi:MAG: hypothetical protein EZS28_054757, partial [Streblomastix strix]
GGQESLLKSQYDRRLDGERRRALGQTNELREDFEKAQKHLEEQLGQMQDELADAIHRYESRDPRPEDVARIRQLEASLAEKDHLISRMKEEVKFFKLELINREENYNKTFGRSVNVQPTFGQQLNVQPTLGQQLNIQSSPQIGSARQVQKQNSEGRQRGRTNSPPPFIGSNLNHFFVSLQKRRGFYFNINSHHIH